MARSFYYAMYNSYPPFVQDDQDNSFFLAHGNLFIPNFFESVPSLKNQRDVSRAREAEHQRLLRNKRNTWGCIQSSKIRNRIRNRVLRYSQSKKFFPQSKLFNHVLQSPVKLIKKLSLVHFHRLTKTCRENRGSDLDKEKAYRRVGCLDRPRANSTSLFGTRHCTRQSQRLL